MRILLDQGIPLSLSQILIDQGFQAIHTSQIRLQTASDREIIARAIREFNVIITFDSDFHSILAIDSISNISVIRLRIQGQKAPEIAKFLVPILTTHLEAILQGSAISVTDQRVSIRRLPIK